jgi:hypothetical protein
MITIALGSIAALSFVLFLVRRNARLRAEQD